jgi:hypothetical protein
MNSNGFPSREQVERLRKQYHKGTRIELTEMSDPFATLKAGDRGTVEFVDDAGQIGMAWDSGSHLSLIPGVDRFRKVQLVPDLVRDQILELRNLPDCPNMFDINAVQRLAFDHGLYNLVDFIETDRKAYSEFILTGRVDDVE